MRYVVLRAARAVSQLRCGSHSSCRHNSSCHDPRWTRAATGRQRPCSTSTRPRLQCDHAPWPCQRRALRSARRRLSMSGHILVREVQRSRKCQIWAQFRPDPLLKVLRISGSSFRVVLSSLRCCVRILYCCENVAHGSINYCV